MTKDVSMSSVTEGRRLAYVNKELKCAALALGSTNGDPGLGRDWTTIQSPKKIPSVSEEARPPRRIRDMPIQH